MTGRFDQTLAEAFSFEEADVVANRGGRMSPRQQEQFRAGAAQNRAAGGIVLKILTVAAVGACAFGLFAAQQGGLEMAQVVPPLALALVAVLLVGVFVRRNSRAQAARFEQGAPVQVAQGPVTIDEHPSSWTDVRTTTGWEVAIGGVRFRFLPEQAEAFVPGEPYRVYYCDFGMARLTFLTAERAT